MFGLLLGKAKLIMGYGLLGSTLCLGGLCYVLFLQKGSLKKDVEALDKSNTILSVVNQSQQKALKIMELHRETDGRLVAGLVNRLEGLSAVDKDIRNTLGKLERNNEVVHSYLADSVPPELSCVLSDACRDSARTAGDTAQTASGVGDSVPPPWE